MCLTVSHCIVIMNDALTSTDTVHVIYKGTVGYLDSDSYNVLDSR